MSYEKKSGMGAPLHEDPQQNLRIENEILQIKIQAQYGGSYYEYGKLPPEVENRFLKKVLEFEQRYSEAKRVKIYDWIGNPSFIKADFLPPGKVMRELARMESLLAERNIAVGFIRPRDPLFRYRFITEELFQHETFDLLVPGMMKYFIYEEFHPDHELTLRGHTATILSAWFNRSPEMMKYHLCSNMIQPNGEIYSREEAMKRMKGALDRYVRFEQTHYSIHRICHAPKQESGPLRALGHAEGRLKYVALMKNGRRQIIEGPFKIFFGCGNGSWQTFFFYLPGYNL